MEKNKTEERHNLNFKQLSSLNIMSLVKILLEIYIEQLLHFTQKCY